MAAYVPPGWPAGVHPPGSEDFERTAQAWLLDVVPADYRLHGVLRRYPLALAAMAGHHTKACVAGARDGYRTARTELGNVLPAHALDAVLAAYRAEGRRLVATAHAVDLVTRALRGEVFTPQLQDTPAPGAGDELSARRAAAGNNSAAGSSRSAAGSSAAGSSAAGSSTAGNGSAAGSDSVPGKSSTAGSSSAPGSGGNPAERPGRDGPAKPRKAPPAQRPARDGGTARRKSRPTDKQAAAG